MNDERPVKYTHGHHESVLRSHQRRTAEDSAAYLLPYLKPGLSVLDVGCGPGTITADLAARVAPGPVSAVDQFADVLELARAEAQRRNLSNVSFAIADVHQLDFSGRRVRRRPRPPGAAACRRSGAGAAGDAAGVPAGRNCRGSGCRLRGFHLVPAASRAGFLAGSLPDRRRVPTAANRMPAGGCCRGPSRRDSTTSRRPAAFGATRRPRPVNGGAVCGPTGFCIRAWLASSWPWAWPPPRSLRRSRRRGEPGLRPRMDGFRCRTAKSSAGHSNYAVVPGAARKASAQ